MTETQRLVMAIDHMDQLIKQYKADPSIELLNKIEAYAQEQIEESNKITGSIPEEWKKNK